MKLTLEKDFPKEAVDLVQTDDKWITTNRKVIEGYNTALQEVKKAGRELDVEKLANFFGYNNTIIKIPDERAMLLAEEFIQAIHKGEVWRDE